MNTWQEKYFYILGVILTTLSCIYFNIKTPLGYDELHAYNIAQNISPIDMFIISKSEGHPFLWYYLLMPFAKTNIFFPYSIIVLNLTIILICFYFLYKYAPFPTWLKFLITLSAPFLQLYSHYIRSYSLTILLLFAILSLYKKRKQKLFTILVLLFLLANTSQMGIIATAPFMIILFFENLKDYKKNTIPLLHIIFFGLLEILFMILQFYGFDSDIPSNTPFNTPSLKYFIELSNQTFAPANIYCFIPLVLVSIYLFIKDKDYPSLFFLFFTYTCLSLLFIFYYRGSLYHYNFFYIFLITAFWISSQSNLPKKIFPIAIMAFIIIFNPNDRISTRGASVFPRPIKESALALNNFANKQELTVIALEPFTGEILIPYLDRNITLLNQTMTDYRTIKAYKEILYPFYRKINSYTIAEYVHSHTTPLWLYRTCKDETYINNMLVFQLKHQLNKRYCLYEVTTN